MSRSSGTQRNVQPAEQLAKRRRCSSDQRERAGVDNRVLAVGTHSSPAPRQSYTGSVNGEPPEYQVLQVKTLFHPANVYRNGDVIVRDAGPWAPTVHALLRHLEAVGFDGAPRVVGTGFDDQGRETLSYIAGDFVGRGPWSLEGATGVGQLLRRMHRATASFEAPPDAVWYPLFSRVLGGATQVIGHGDVAPWNIVAHVGIPVAFIDWDRAGPIDPLVELAQACWLNAKLHDDIVAAREGLPPLAERARHLRAILDGYGLAAPERRTMVQRMIELAVHSVVEEVDDAGVTHETRSEDVAPELLWAVAWKSRGATWMMRHRRDLENALV